MSTQQALIDDIINSINILAFRATEAVERGLLSADPANIGFRIPSGQSSRASEEAAFEAQEKAKQEIEKGVHQLETLLENKIDKNFDKFEVWSLRNILSVPHEVRDWVRLSHYEGLNFYQGEDAPTVDSITTLRKRLRETQKLHALLLAEVERNEATNSALRALLGKQPVGQEAEQDAEQTFPTFAFLQNKGDLTGDISTTTSFAISQLPALKALLANLKPRVEALAKGTSDRALVGEEEKSWRRERLEFVEKETRKHLEDVRGLELGEMGEVRDGEWQGAGRTISKQEVEDLERVVGMVTAGESQHMDEENRSMDEGP